MLGHLCQPPKEGKHIQPETHGSDLKIDAHKAETHVLQKHIQPNDVCLAGWVGPLVRMEKEWEVQPEDDNKGLHKTRDLDETNGNVMGWTGKYNQYSLLLQKVREREEQKQS